MALQIIHQSRILVLRGQHAKIQVPAVKACGKDLRLAKHQNIHDVIPYLRRSRSCKALTTGRTGSCRIKSTILNSLA